MEIREESEKETDGGVIWNNPNINIKWPLERVENIILSEKDKVQPSLNDLDLKEYEDFIY